MFCYQPVEIFVCSENEDVHPTWVVEWNENDCHDIDMNAMKPTIFQILVEPPIPNSNLLLTLILPSFSILFAVLDVLKL